jgi:hypothetical protein
MQAQDYTHRRVLHCSKIKGSMITFLRWQLAQAMMNGMAVSRAGKNRGRRPS